MDIKYLFLAIVVYLIMRLFGDVWETCCPNCGSFKTKYLGDSEHYCKNCQSIMSKSGNLNKGMSKAEENHCSICATHLCCFCQYKENRYDTIRNRSEESVWHFKR